MLLSQGRADPTWMQQLPGDPTQNPHGLEGGSGKAAPAGILPPQNQELSLSPPHSLFPNVFPHSQTTSLSAVGMGRIPVEQLRDKRHHRAFKRGFLWFALIFLSQIPQRLDPNPPLNGQTMTLGIRHGSKMDWTPPSGGGASFCREFIDAINSPRRDCCECHNTSSSQSFIHQALSCFFWEIFTDWETFREEGSLLRVSPALRGQG